MKNNNLNSVHFGTVIAAIILCVLCLALPVYQWASIPESHLVKILMGAAALALGICKLTFIPLAAENYVQGKHLSALCLFFVAVLALAISVSASQDLLNSITLTKQKNSNVNGLVYRNAQITLNDLNAEVKTLNGLLASDQAAGYRKRAYNHRENLRILKQERTSAAEKVERLSSTSHNLSGGTFGKNITLDLAGFIVSLRASTGAALALHLTCIFSVLAVTAWKPERNQRGSNIDANKQPRKSGKLPAATRNSLINGEAENSSNKTESIQVLNSEQKRLADEIVIGVFGDAPVLRDLIASKVIKGGHKKIGPVFDYLVGQKQLVKSGKGFALVQKTISPDLYSNESYKDIAQ